MWRLIYIDVVPKELLNILHKRRTTIENLNLHVIQAVSFVPVYENSSLH